MTDFPIRRVAIVNRGEPAMRLINAVRDFNLENGTAIETVALYTDSDRQAMFVREADLAFELGPAVIEAADGSRRVGYLDYGRLEAALTATAADAVWAGWGFVAEHADFADLCAHLDVVFIGPDGDTMRRLGDKITSKQIAEQAGVPVVPWSGGAVDTIEAALTVGNQLGYPLMIKATAGGGGRGIRRVRSPDDLAGLLESARSEAASAFGDPTVFLERAVLAAKHIEVQIIADHRGTVWPVGVRDCSVQRRNQKIIEEAPSPALSADQHASVLEAAASLGRAAGYTNAGTVEFLFDPASGEFWFMEVNARLQVEHPITELTTGADLVKLQLHVAAGYPLEGDPPATTGHAIEMRLNAEDPSAGFAPAPGRLDVLRFPTGPGIRVDTGVEEGDAIAPEFDSMIAKIMAVGRDRTEAISRLRRALRQTVVIVRDGASNKAFVEALLADPIFASAEFDIGWVDGLGEGVVAGESGLANVAIVGAGIAAYDEETLIDRNRFKASANRGRPEVDAAIGRKVGLRYRGNAYEPLVRLLDTGLYAIEVGGETVHARVEDTGELFQRIHLGGRTHRLLSVVERGTHAVEVDGVPHRISHDEGGVIRAPSPSVVVSLAVAAGDTVERGDRIAVVEAMKMETQIGAPFSGTVREVLVRENTQVGPGTPLVLLEPDVEADEPTFDVVSFTPLAAASMADHVACEHHLAEIKAMLAGYDVDPGSVARSIERGDARCADTLQRATLVAREDEILSLFVDVISLFRRDPIDYEFDDVTRRSSEEQLFSFLKDTSTTSGLPDRFTARLERALRHYDVDLDSDPDALDRALYRIAKSHDRMSHQVPAVLAILDRRLSTPGTADDSFHEVLDRIIQQTRDRFPAVHDLAREVSYRLFDQPFLEEVQQQAYREAERHVEILEAGAEGEARSEQILALVESPQPLTAFLSQRFRSGHPKENSSLLEVMVRRYYRTRRLEHVQTREVHGLSVASAEYDWDDRRITVAAIHVVWGRLREAGVALRAIAESIADPTSLVADLYVWHPDAPGSIDGMCTEVAAMLDDELGPSALRRIVASVSTPGGGLGIGGVLNFTYRPDGAGGYREETVHRDLHPMMSKRLQLERFDAFDLRRLPTLEDIYLFHGAARDNPNDQRLFAVAEVRDLTPIRNDRGEVVRLPEFERVFHDVLGSIRRFQAHLPTHKRLIFNRAMLYVWPVLELTRSEIDGLVERLGRETEGIGLQSVEVSVRMRTPGSAKVVPSTLEFSNPGGSEISVRLRRTRDEPILPLSPIEQKVVRLRRRGLHHPVDVIESLTRSAAAPRGDFQEYDLVERALEPVHRPLGENSCNIVAGVVTNPSSTYPEGMRRVILIGDPSRGMGNLAEAECARIVAGMDLAEREGLPLEWFAVSAGARISMESGTENMDWIGLVLRRLVEFTQGGSEVNIVVTGINVGAQPYWNAEATMLMHTKGILIMAPESAMVLTGKQALDYSGGVSAEDNQGIGGYERIMGPNGQAQYFARDLADACQILLRHYEYSYAAPGEAFPRRADTADPADRDISDSPHGGEFALVGDVFSETTNPGRKKPFDIRQVMAAVVDRDHATLERWYGMQHAEVGVVWDARLGGHAVSLLGFESRPITRAGFVPADGPDQWTSGTLFPVASKKIARAINAASGIRPIVVLANLSGFDGSPESMRNLQLEYGAEIGRAVVNFEGPIVFCVISRYHGGAFVVFSNKLNDNMEIAAVRGARASVIGGAPAAAVVFARDVRRRTDDDPRVVELARAATVAEGSKRTALRAELDTRREEIYSEKLGEVADEFDTIHDIDRALEVGSVHTIVEASQLRPYLIDAVERGMAKHVARSR